MNAMQELAIKYPTLWEHIAKGGKVRGCVWDAQKNGPECVLITLSPLTVLPFGLHDGTFYEDIELLPLPKRTPTKDLGKAVNYFYRTSPWYYENGYFCNPEIIPEGLAWHQLSITINYIYAVITGSANMPDWWPEELKEDEEC